jgi:hypothetical protein
VPPGTTEAAVGSFEHDIADLPSKQFFIKTLDRPHYANEDKNGIPPWMRRRRGGDLPPPDPAPQPAKPAAAEPQRQVSNQAPTTLASAQKP